MFFYPSNISINEEEKSSFQNHVLDYLKRLDIVKEEEGYFTLDLLNNEKDRYGHESYIAITYLNDLYKWTAERTGITFIRVSIEKRDLKNYPLKEFEEKPEINNNGEYINLPF